MVNNTIQNGVKNTVHKIMGGTRPVETVIENGVKHTENVLCQVRTHIRTRGDGSANGRSNSQSDNFSLVFPQDLDRQICDTPFSRTV